MNSQERSIMFITCFGHFLSHFNMLVFPAVLLPMAERLNMDMATVMGFSFWMYLLFGLTALPWGIAADKWGVIPFMFLFYLGAGLSGISAAIFIDSPTAFTLSLAGIGFFSGIYHPVGLGWISKEFRRISIGMAYNGIFGNIGLAMGPLLTGIVNWFWGLRAVYFVLGGINLFGILLLCFSPRFKEDGEKTETENSDNSEKDESSFKAFFLLLIAMMFGGIVYQGATLILPAYFEIKNQGIFDFISSLTGIEFSENVVATTATSLIFIIGILGQYYGGVAGERFELRKSYLFFHAMVIPAAFLMAIAADLPLIITAVIYFFFLLGMQPIENTLVAKFTPKRLHSAAYGTKFIMTFGVGSFAVKLVEWIEKGFGIDAVFPSLGFISMMLVGAIFILILNTKPLKSKSGIEN